MSVANIKISSTEIRALQRYTGETTGQKAVQKALLYFLKEARQRKITEVIQMVSFKKNFNPLKLRHHER